MKVKDMAIILINFIKVKKKILILVLHKLKMNQIVGILLIDHKVKNTQIINHIQPVKYRVLQIRIVNMII